MAATITSNYPGCVTPTLFAMQMERALGPINMVPVGIKNGAIEFAGLTDGRPRRQPLVRIDGHKSYAEHIYKSAIPGKGVEGSAFLDQVRGLDSFMDETEVMPLGAYVGKELVPRQLTIRQIAAGTRKCMKLDRARRLDADCLAKDVIKGLAESAGPERDSLNYGKTFFNSAVLHAGLGDKESRHKAANLFLESAKILNNLKLNVSTAIAAEYGLEMFMGTNDMRESEAAKLAINAWLLSAEKCANKDWPGFLISVRNGLLIAMNLECCEQVTQFLDRAAKTYQKAGRPGVAADYHLRAAISVLQHTEWVPGDWKVVRERLHRAEHAMPSLHAADRKKIKALAQLSNMAKEMFS